jgi:hypothetical protein
VKREFVNGGEEKTEDRRAWVLNPKPLKKGLKKGVRVAQQYPKF